MEVNSKKTGFLYTTYDRISKYSNIDVKHRKRAYFTCYTVAFAICAFSVFVYFILTNKSLVWYSDSIFQHINALKYLGVTTRDTIRAFFSTGTLAFPLWDFSAGLGADVINTFHYYGLGDPLSIFAVFTPSAYMEHLYNFLIVLRLYLAGLAFSYYGFYVVKHKGSFAILIGAIAYTFSSYSMVAYRHPFFLNYLIYLPLLLVGVEKILNKQRPYLFISMIFVSAISNFYFFYMLCIFIVVYTFIRFFVLVKENRVQEFLKLFAKFLGYGVIGVLMACVIFLPNVLTLLATDRMNTDSFTSLFYSFEHYLKAPYTIISNFGRGGLGNWGNIGMSSLTLLAVLLLFTNKKKEHKQLKIGLLILTVIFLFPALGSFMNGFSYPSNRWVGGFCFFLALTITVVLPNFYQIKFNQWKVILCFSTIYLLIPLVVKEIRQMPLIVNLAIYAITLLCFTGFYFLQKQMHQNKKQYRISMNVFLTLLFFMSVVLNAFSVYATSLGNYTTKFLKRGESVKYFKNSAAAAVKKVGDEEFYRFDQNKYDGQSVLINAGLDIGQNGVDYYWSMTDAPVSQYIKENENIGAASSFKNYGFDNRAMLDTLASVKYFAVKPGLERYLPYGFHKKVSENKNNLVYENEFALPIGYTYKSAIHKDEYYAFTAAQKQQAVYQGVVLENDIQALHKTDLTFTDEAIPYTLKCGEGIEYKDNKFYVKDKNAKVEILFESQSDADLYVSIQGLNYFEQSPLEKYSQEKFSKLSISQKLGVLSDNLFWVAKSSANVRLKMGDINKSVSYHTPEYTWYSGYHDFLVNMGYHTQTSNTIDLSFGEVGVYELESLSVIKQPMENYGQQVEDLRQDVLEDVSIETNKVSGKIDLQESKFLCFSIPYSKGWTAYVNGEKKELLQANTMYMGLPLEAGSYSIELKYSTAGLKLGLGLSLCGALSLGILVFAWERRRRKVK